MTRCKEEIQMKKYTAAHMRPNGSNMYLNGGHILVSEQEIVVMYGSREVARMDKAQATVEKCQPHLFYCCVQISDSTNGAEIMFFPWTAKKFSKDFGI